MLKQRVITAVVLLALLLHVWPGGLPAGGKVRGLMGPGLRMARPRAASEALQGAREARPRFIPKTL